MSVDPNQPQLSPDFQELLQQIEILKDGIQSRRRTRGLDFYIPNHIQYKAHNSQAKTVVVVKGNRMGGTHLGAAEIALHTTKRYPEWYPVEKRYKRPLKIRIGTDKFFKFGSVIEPKLRELMPADFWAKSKIRRGPQGYLLKMETPDGSYIEFLTGEQDQMAWEGQDLDIFWGDEPQKRSHWIATQRGLIDRGGRSILTFTPLIEPWMKEEIVDIADGKEIEVFYGDTRDNMFDIEGNTILKEEDIARFEAFLTDDEKETRIHGKFFHLKGVVYKEFNPEVHCVSDSDFSYEHGYPVYCVMDPHDRLPHHIIWAMVDRVDDIYVMYELIKEGTVRETASTILATEKYFNWNIVKRVIDPNFGKKPLISTGLSVIQEFRKYRTSFTEANDSKDAGRMKVKELLHYNRSKPIDINNRPKLYFVRERTPKTIRSLQTYQYDEWKGTDDKDPKEEVKQKDTHGADVVRYLAMADPRFYEPQVFNNFEDNPY